MGLLDDAIREHLELKRRRGADPSEIEREESEALGPVRREVVEDVEPEPEASAGSYADHEPAALDEPGAVYDDDPFVDHEPEPYEPPVTHDAPYAEREDESASPPHGDPLAHEQTREFSSVELDEALGQHEAPPAPPAEPPADVVPADDEPDAEDELEETPDFLQETPEHDRLWFEQKPPKDFDF
ncbi:hypothetical protein DSM104299_00264 [Baekduia alba]|uniref:hypothetical protein n=1 Tax=Baekduia alba TaxID=2997333 RepID=UPI002340DC22|nr:hypothetical protein [Baekduia alba]WCB91592.1 hypothetical protein DSM104299_00264 [Baekduia alba]